MCTKLFHFNQKTSPGVNKTTETRKNGLMPSLQKCSSHFQKGGALIGNQRPLLRFEGVEGRLFKKVPKMR